LNYVNEVYNLAFKLHEAMAGKRIADISSQSRAYFMILMRITDFLRCIQMLTVKGYPEQAGTLAASIFELGHTAATFHHAPDKAAVWVRADSIKQQMPKGLGGHWKDVVTANSDHLGDGTCAESEYQVYQQLCWMKHSLPKMQDMRVEQGEVALLFGPYTDERSINHAWFTLEHARRLAELVIALLLPDYGSVEAKAALHAIGEQRAHLREKARMRFGLDNPFLEVNSGISPK
jgi:hypothetical protein